MHSLSKTIVFAILLAFVSLSPASASQPDAVRPNILWITCEDMSPHLGCYGDTTARTPHVDRLAAEGIRFTQAFATAPVCSPARSCLITGMYATSLGTQHLRSVFPVPSHVRPFPEYLRAAGYYCTNNVKTDYNVANEKALIAAAWDESSDKAHWRGRRPDQPFFSVFNLMTTHQSRTGVWPEEEFEQMIAELVPADERHKPDSIPIPPYYPATPVVAQSLARYYDCITAMDRQVGELLGQLQADGLAESTIVFFYADHGMGLPRGKRTLYDSGLRVPLIIRVPPQFQDLIEGQPGTVDQRLVSFVDFAPTMLSLVGLPIPEHMQGAAFVGPKTAAPREYVYGARDRVDEAFDTARSVRDGRFLYIRNFRPHLPWHQPEGYSDNAELRREITRLAGAGKLNAAQRTYAGPERPQEELFDCQADPHQIRNLLRSDAHADTLQRMREELDRWIMAHRDLGFLPEEEIWKRCRATDITPYELAQDPRQYPLDRLLAAAKLVNGSSHLPMQEKLLKAPDAGVRYWAAVGIRAAGTRASRVRSALQTALMDDAASVRIEAAGALLLLGDDPQAVEVLTATLERKRMGRSLDAALQATRTLQLAGERARPALPEMQQALQEAVNAPFDDPQFLFLQFSLSAAIEQLQPAP